MTKKSLLTTYLLWFFGGVFGLHHFYLGRDRHGILHLLSLNGYFGIGWIRDSWKIPEYVRDANEDEDYMKVLASKMLSQPVPPHTMLRSLARMVVGDALGYLVLAAIPSELVPKEYMALASILVPLGSAIGVHTVCNIGREKCDFKYILGAAYAIYPFFFFDNKSPVFLTTLSATAAHESFGKEWRRTPSKKRSACFRFSIVTLCTLIYLSLWASSLYFNCEIDSETDQPVKCRDAARHFFKSPMWNEFLSVLKEVWQIAQHHGFSHIWRTLIEALDPQGEANALKVLGLKSTASDMEINAQYRKLSKMWHPDKHQDLHQKEIAQEKFIEIQSAYQTLSQKKSLRATRNTKKEK